MEAVRDNLDFSLEAWPEIGYSCDFVLAPSLLAPFLVMESFDSTRPPDEPPRLLTSMRGRLDIQLLGQRLIVKGVFAVKVEMVCDRCLGLFVGKVGDRINETVPLIPRGQETEADSSDGFVTLDGNQFSLTPFLVELFWLSWPFKLLCKPDCAGLCPDCGVNLNETTCKCKSGPTRH